MCFLQAWGNFLCWALPRSSAPGTQFAKTFQLLTGWAEVKNVCSELTLAWVLWPTQRNIIQSSGGKKKCREGSQELCNRLAIQALLKTGFLLVLLCVTPALGSWNPERLITLLFLLEGGQAVPFLFQVFSLDLGRCRKTTILLNHQARVSLVASV